MCHRFGKRGSPTIPNPTASNSMLRPSSVWMLPTRFTLQRSAPVTSKIDQRTAPRRRGPSTRPSPLPRRVPSPPWEEATGAISGRYCRVMSKRGSMCILSLDLPASSPLPARPPATRPKPRSIAKSPRTAVSSERQAPHRQYAVAVLGEVASAALAAEVERVSFDVDPLAGVFYLKDGAAHGAVDVLADQRTWLRNGLGVAAPHATHAFAAALERGIHWLPWFEPPALGRRLRRRHGGRALRGFLRPFDRSGITGRRHGFGDPQRGGGIPEGLVAR